MKLIAGYLLTAVVLQSASGCSRPRAPQPEIKSPALIIIDGGINVQHTTANQEVVTCDVDEDYPAQRAIGQITTRLDKLGWRPLKEDFLDPGIETSLVRGWTDFEDDVRRVHVFQWIGQWEAADGEIAWYVLSYTGKSVPGGASPVGPLKVRATVVSPDTVKRLRQEGKEQKPV